MSAPQLMRHALAEMLDQFKDRRPDQILFTSFNFSAAFFETNVLPLLCGNDIDEIKGATLTRALLNRQLATRQTVVACDHSTQPEPKGDLRYGLMTVGLRQGRFHPKLILMSGTLNSGQQGLWLSVGSGNLTHSGWGSHREVVGTTVVTQAHAVQLTPLLQWLLAQAQATVGTAGEAASSGKEEGGTRDVLMHLLDALSQHGTPDNNAAGLPALHLALPHQVHLGHPQLLAALLDGQRWQQVEVMSPFWANVPFLLNTIGAEHARLVPTMQSERGYVYPAVGGLGASVSYRRFRHEPERYTHAKAMLLASPGQRVLCIGSANFTTAALWHGEGQLANVEAMLRYQVGSHYSWDPLLTELDRQDAPDADDEQEGAPPLPPFTADLLYDWRDKQFHCTIKLAANHGLSRLELEAGPLKHLFLVTTPGAAELHAVLPATLRQPLRSYKLHYIATSGDASYLGLVMQLNANDDVLDYAPRPQLDRLLAFLHTLAPGKPQDRDDAGTGGDGGAGSDGGDASDGADPDGEDNAEPALDFFSFFLATEKLRRYYQARPRSAESPLGCGSASIYALHRAVTGQPAQTPAARIARYVQLAELQETLAYFQRDWPRPATTPSALDIEDALRSELQGLELEIAPLFAQSPQWCAMFAPHPPDARTFFHWFRQELHVQ